MKHLMLDLETLDSESTAAVISIGAVFFNTELGMLGPEFKVNIKFSSALKYGTVSGDTLEWWAKQSEEARAHLFTPEPIDLPSALKQFTNYLAANGDKTESGHPAFYVWGNGSTFDNVILRHAYKQVGQSILWGFRWDSCFRTLKNQFDPTSKFYTESRVGVAHDSLSDAISQARHAIAIFQSLEERVTS